MTCPTSNTLEDLHMFDEITRTCRMASKDTVTIQESPFTALTVSVKESEKQSVIAIDGAADVRQLIDALESTVGRYEFTCSLMSADTLIVETHAETTIIRARQDGKTCNVFLTDETANDLAKFVREHNETPTATFGGCGESEPELPFASSRREAKLDLQCVYDMHARLLIGDDEDDLELELIDGGRMGTVYLSPSDALKLTVGIIAQLNANDGFDGVLNLQRKTVNVTENVEVLVDSTLEVKKSVSD